jgi:hypothetical protein
MRLPCYCTAFLCCTATIAMAAERSNDQRASVQDVEASEPARHYAIFFSYQSPDNRIRLSHTFAAFLRVSGPPHQPRVEQRVTISWLPVSGVVSLARHAEPGVNKPLRETLAWAEERGLEIKCHGPFEIQAELFQRAALQEQRLNDRRYLYKVYDATSRGSIKNCIHAVADIVQDDGCLETGTARGHEATSLVVEHLRSYFHDHEPATGSVAAALFDALGVEGAYVPRRGNSLASR